MARKRIEDGAVAECPACEKRVTKQQPRVLIGMERVWVHAGKCLDDYYQQEKANSGTNHRHRG